MAVRSARRADRLGPRVRVGGGGHGGRKERLRALTPGVYNIVVAWVLTLPAAALIGAGTYGLTRVFGTGAAGPVVVSVLVLIVVTLVFARRLQQGSPLTAAEG